MAATTADLEAIRSWVGDTPSDSSIQSTWVAAGETVEATALSILRRRRANLVADPLKFGADGDWSQDATANLKALDADIATLDSLVSTVDLSGGLPTVTTSKLLHPGQAR